MASVYYSFHTVHPLYAAQTFENGVKAVGVAHVKAQGAFENAVVRLYVHFAHIDAEVVGHHIGQIEQQPHAVDAHDFDRGERRQRFVLRPLYLLLHYALAVLRSEAVKLVARGFVDDYLVRYRVFEPHHAVARDGFAAVGDHEVGRFATLFSVRFLLLRRAVVVRFLDRKSVV